MYGRRGLFLLGFAALLLLVACRPTEEPTAPHLYLVGYQGPELPRSLRPFVVDTIPELSVALLRIEKPRIDGGISDRIRYWSLGTVYQRVSPVPELVALSYGWQWYLDWMGIGALWEYGRGAGVTVGLFDTGLDGSHPALGGALIDGFDAGTGESLPAGVDFSEGQQHATHVAGILVGHGVIDGVAPEARLFPVRIFNPTYVGDFAVAAAIVEASHRGVGVFNFSFGGFAFSPVLYDAVSYVLERGGWILAAAGNFGDARPFFPAAMPGVIAVGASGPDGRRTDFSNWGSWVDLYAPGLNLYSSIPGGGYAFLSGTSMATPVAAGVAAVLQGREVALDARGLRWLFRKHGVLAPELLLNIEDAPRGGCLRLRVMDSGTPVSGAWVTLRFSDEVFRAPTDRTGRVRFFAMPLGKALVEVTFEESGVSRLHQQPITVYPNCSWETPVELGSFY